MPNKHIGSSFEDFLKEEGTYEETTLQAIKEEMSTHDLGLLLYALCHYYGERAI